MGDVQTNDKGKGRELRRSADDTFDRIYKFYFGKKELVLNSEEEVIRERWDLAWKLLSNMLTRREVVDGIMAAHQVQKTVAYDDVNKAMMLFGDPQHSTKEAKKLILEEWITMGIKKAWEHQDMKAYEKLLARYAKLNKLDGEAGADIADLMKNFKAHSITIFSSPEELQREAKKLQENIIQDVDYADLTGDGGEED